MNQKFVVAKGDPFNGMELYGPFSNGDEAGDWARDEFKNETWWLLPLIYVDEEA